MDGVTDIRRLQSTDPRQRLGATFVAGEGVHIRLWAPKARDAQIEWAGQGRHALKAEDDGYFTGFFPNARPGDRYFFYLDGRKTPDPASKYQPEDIYGPSEVTARDFAWTDKGWRGVPFEAWVIYEVHVGAYSARHDFQGVIEDLPRLKKLGITAIEIMPVSQFPGARNWGYDGVFPHAVQHSYGGPTGLKALVDACHAEGLAVVLDVVYNHIGPEGNALFACGPYVQDKYRTPWGDALNFDGADSDHVRRYFLQALWDALTEFHLDGLRLDAVQTILDTSPLTFLEEASLLRHAAEKAVGRPLVLIGESDMNDPRLVTPLAQRGTGFDAHWADDLHHALHATLTGEKDGYYADYGGAEQLARIYERGVAFEGEYSPFRRRRHGRSYDGIEPKRLVVETQNHDQIGNRMRGDRLASLVDQSRLKLAAAAVLLSPFTPFLFMGEEWGAREPFSYFISHHDEKLVTAVREGRRAEWKAFGWQEEPPDPAAPATFESCVLHDKTAAAPAQAEMLAYYTDLIRLSRQLRQRSLTVTRETDCVMLRYAGEAEILVLLSFGKDKTRMTLPEGSWDCLLGPAHENKIRRFDGALALAPFSVFVLQEAKP